ncbi:Pycsar system effector family protein [Streptomyces rishiriensis]|uniref:Pycsar system effector family protein n=1 Tax=Streptomyces rishiriensis TaxID=68264 RepID=UPI0037AB81B8
MSAPGTPTGEAAAQFVAARLLAVIREDAGRADAKASFLLTLVVALPTLLLGITGLPHGRARAAPVLFALAVAGWLTGLGALVHAVLPRSGTRRSGPGLTYYADVLALHRDDGIEGIRNEAARAGRDPAVWLLTQAVDVSAILAQKYRWIRWGICSALGALVCATVGLLVG